MMTGTWSVACLLLAAGTGASPVSPDGVTFCNKTTLDFPITVDPSRLKSIRELELYVSSNQGRTWDLAARATPSQSLFRCSVPGEGLYWFTVLIIDQHKRKEPPTPYGAEPGQKLIVDMKKPDVRLVSAERKDGTVVVRWDISEEYLNLPSLRLEYRPTDGPETWTSVPITREQSGQAVIDNPAAVTVRLSVEDMAHNVGMAEAKVPAAASASTTVASRSTESTSDAAGSGSAGASPPAPPVSGSAATAVSTLPPSLPPVAAPSSGSASPVASSETPPVPPAGDPPLQRVSTSPTPPRSSLGSSAVEDLTPPPSSSKEPGGVVASSPTAVGPTPPASLPSVTPEKDLAVQVINTRRVTMEYEVAKLGPSGVGSVDLYVTRDNGLKWDRIEGDYGASPPASGGKHGEALHRTLSVDLATDGVYGFYLVVKSGAGRGQEPPRTGKPPQWRVEIDTSRPEALLYGPQASPGQPDVLVLSWKATDNRLAPSPISLQWAERKDGEWHNIGEAQMPNTGSYNWHVPANIPAKVLLRLTVRDVAGNVAVAETGEPILVDLSVPEPRILGLVKSGAQ
ncbi:MAG TPA: hypothetical protein VKD72_23725 [Gemmataceae bacterium]|nr:hypothetical protein [Gemmataceae bacterium]